MNLRSRFETWLADADVKGTTALMRDLVDAVDELCAASERVLSERDDGLPDPFAWIALRNAVRTARSGQ